MSTCRWAGPIAAVALLMSAPLAGCSSEDDGSDVRAAGTTVPGSTTDSRASEPGSSDTSVTWLYGGLSGEGSASGPSSSSASGSGSATAVGEAKCSPVGEDLEASADEVVEIGLLDYAFEGDSFELQSGIVTFAASNLGSENHELAVLPGGGAVPKLADGEPDEEALAAAGAFELEAFGPGQDCSATWDLRPGNYTIFCLVRNADGVLHSDLGMVRELAVS